MTKRTVAPPVVLSPLDRERAFWRMHREELTARYPDQFVAVRRATGEIVAVAPHLADVWEAARQLGFDQGDVWARKMITKPLMLIL
ncbi:MAG TPA: DUF5678 domain-containing protein [Dehalococcoidia bacterium]|nr:DUF5678 domain-containing protein [Dehalococcoidia bacterium]